MKKIAMALASALMMLTACTSEEPQKEKPTGMEAKTITFTFGDTFQTKAMTRAAITSLSLTDLWMFDYVGDELQQTIHQSSTDDGFGSISASMGYGSHTIYFVASRGTTPTTDTSAKTITWAKPSDTYWATSSITVAPSSSVSQAVTLGRVATRLQITVTDEVPANAAVFTVTPSQWYYGIDYTTGSPTAATPNRTISVNIPASEIGVSNEIVTIFGFSAVEEWTTDIALDCQNSSGTILGQAAITGAPFKRNRITSYSGPLFSRKPTFSMTVDDSWNTDIVDTW